VRAAIQDGCMQIRLMSVAATDKQFVKCSSCYLYQLIIFASPS